MQKYEYYVDQKINSNKITYKPQKYAESQSFCNTIDIIYVLLTKPDHLEILGFTDPT